MKKIKQKILCTLGPKSFNKKTISRLGDIGIDIFRLNLSHTELDDLEDQIKLIQSYTDIPLCLDTEGAQIRTGKLKQEPIFLKDDSIINIPSEFIEGNEKTFNLYPSNIISHFDRGDLISVDFHCVLLQVIEKHQGSIILKVINGGPIGSNKAVTVNRKIPLLFLTAKDRKSISIGLKYNIKNFALSFAENGNKVENFRQIIGQDSFLISKIESIDGFRNRKEIIIQSDAILIDRGDLSRELSIEKIPQIQEILISAANKNKTEVYVATNLLESMVHQSLPTRAEVNDVYHTLKTGADGLVLAAETAIGENPIQSTAMIRRLIDAYNSSSLVTEDQLNSQLYTIQPHGGKLVNNFATNAEIKASTKYKRIIVDQYDLLDAQQIALGTYSPLSGFMNKEALESVLEMNKLPDGNIWTLPIILQIDKTKNTMALENERIILTSNTKEAVAFMDVEHIEQIDIEKLSLSWFGTNSINHPGVKQFQSKGNHIISGKITLIKKLESPNRIYDFSPSETRFIFQQKGWNRVIGFHTRNPIHRAHEYIQKMALELVDADGVYISPVIGPKISGDFLPEIVLGSYEIMLNQGYFSSQKFLLGSFNTYSRFSGPKEAVFTAICRKNMGCTHFIVGRDHAGVGDFYSEDGNRKLFESLGDIDIKPIFFNPVGYDKKRKLYREESADGKLQKLSGTKIRQSIQNSEPLPNWYMRKEVQTMIKNHKKRIFSQ